MLFLCEMTPKRAVAKEKIHELRMGRVIHTLYANGEVVSEIATITHSSSFPRGSQEGYLGFIPGASKDVGNSGADTFVRGMV